MYYGSCTQKSDEFTFWPCSLYSWGLKSQSPTKSKHFYKQKKSIFTILWRYVDFMQQPHIHSRRPRQIDHLNFLQIQSKSFQSRPQTFTLNASWSSGLLYVVTVTASDLSQHLNPAACFFNMKSRYQFIITRQTFTRTSLHVISMYRSSPSIIHDSW